MEIRRLVPSTVVWVFLLELGGCATPEAVRCNMVEGTWWCPAGWTCHPNPEIGCVSPEQVAACENLGFGAPWYATTHPVAHCDSIGCVKGACGDSVLDLGEECDDASDNDNERPDACRMTCEAPSCGDGVVDAGEACDDGNTVDGDGCAETCATLDPATGLWDAAPCTRILPFPCEQPLFL